MKRYFPLLTLSLIGLFAVSCSDRDNDHIVNDNDTFPVAYEITNENFVSVNGVYTIAKTFNREIPKSDVILVYRLSGQTNDGSNVWQQIPRTLYFENGELDYDYDFSSKDIAIYAGGSININAQEQDWKNQDINRQTFRVVFIPATTGQSSSNVKNKQIIRNWDINNTKVIKL